MAPDENEYMLYEFPSFPSLSFDERRRLTYTAMLIFYLTDCNPLSMEKLDAELVTLRPNNPASNMQYEHTYYGPYGTTLEEFLQLPEIACIMYSTSITAIHCPSSDIYESFMYRFSKTPNKIHNFRFCIIQCMMEAAKHGQLHKFGALPVEDLCKIFNNFKPIQKKFRWQISLRGALDFLDGLSLISALCELCSRDVVVYFSNRKPPTIRLRNEPKYLLFKQIEPDRVLTEEAIEYFDYYTRTDNPENLDWDNLLSHESGGYDPSEVKEIIPQKPSLGYFIDNVYAAIHYSPDVHDFASLSKSVLNFTKTKLDARIRYRLTTNTKMNMLLDMVSNDALAALDYWEQDKINIYMDIVNELTDRLDDDDRLFVFKFIELNAEKPKALMNFKFWALNRMAKNILDVARTNQFIGEQKIAERIHAQFGYDIFDWLMNFGICNISEIFEKEQLNKIWYYCLCIKLQDNEYVYRNMQSVMKDPYLEDGFPFTAKKRLLNCLQEGYINPYWPTQDDQYFTEDTVKKLYRDCHAKELHAESLFGQNYNCIADFLRDFFVDSIGYQMDESSGQMLYFLTKKFDVAYDDVLKFKKQCHTSLKLWNGMNQQELQINEAGPQTGFSLWKLTRLNYGLEVLKRSRILLSRAKPLPKRY